MKVEEIVEGEYTTYKIPEASLRESFDIDDDPIVGMLWAGIPEDGKVNPYLLVTVQKTIVLSNGNNAGEGKIVEANG